ERVGVVAELSAGRQLLELLGVAASEHDVLGHQRAAQALDDLGDRLAPARLAEALQSAQADVVLERAALLELHVAELHPLEGAVDDHRRAEAGAEAEEEHTAAFVAAERLHGGIIQ